MKKIFFLLIIVLSVASFAQSAMLEKFKQKIKDRAAQRTDEGMDKAMNKNFFNAHSGLSCMKIAIAPATKDNWTIYLRSERADVETFSNAPKPLVKLGSSYDKPIHVAIWIQKERFRLWMNGEKLYDVPQVVPEKSAFNRLSC
ncbi:hypothetical protein [Pinibacter soli]|uniref:LamG domain-containing protein n=1 Tax=Pinibacter soli TaxID=3044211 RepID=A0ABT6RFQ0_9BACT|nr:hypothetical protein [Pinibacter soli]MDI3320687.1 hypothetical protein [Pinibacter soli]